MVITIRSSRRTDASTVVTPPPPPTGYPDATNTGVPAGTALTAVPATVTSGAGWAYQASGNYIRADTGALLSNLDITCPVEVYGNSVTIQNCRIVTTGEGWAVGARAVSGLIVQDTSMNGNGQRLQVCVKDVTGSSEITVLRCDCADWSTAIQMSRGLVQDCYVHDPKFISGDHTNGFTDNGGRLDGTMTLLHNTFLNPFNQTDAISLFQDFGVIHNVTVDNNLMAGGSYALYAGGGSSGPATNVSITNNKFSTMYYSTCGVFGPVTAWDRGATNTWSNNTWFDGSKAGQTIGAP